MNAWRALLQAAAPEQAALQAACADPQAQQEAWLLALLAGARGTAFGREHGFARIRCIEDYRAAVPVRDDTGFAPWIERVAAGEGGVLTAAPVIAFEETGGSGAGAKLVPYTAASLHAFRAAVLPWLAALAKRRPRLCDGPAYAAISPRMRPPRRLPAGVAVGLSSEAAYMGEALHAPLSELLVAPRDALESDAARWRIGTLAALVATPDLAFVSIYSPTFLLGLIEALPACADAVAARVSTAHAARLHAALAGGAVDTQRLWPRLDTIAAWTEGASAPYAGRLAAMFPHVHLDARGVLATESAITLRIDDCAGCVPALTSALLEFVDAHGHASGAHQLEQGQCYRVLLTTPGGLYRYDIQDEFRCVGHEGRAPRLEFIGRSGIASDLVGEKLTDAFVARALAGLSLPAALVPARAARPHYELWLDAPPADHDALARGVDAQLRQNPQYGYARDTGQLDPVRAVASPGLMRHRHAALVQRGMRAGDVKPANLILDRATLPPPHGTALP